MLKVLFKLATSLSIMSSPSNLSVTALAIDPTIPLDVPFSTLIFIPVPSALRAIPSAFIGDVVEEFTFTIKGERLDTMR